MVEKKFSYYQFHKELDYQVYLRLEDFDLESQLADIFESMGFDKVERNKIKDRKFDLKTTKILCINRASFKVCRQINLSHHLDVYGPESLSKSKDFELYKYKEVGLMLINPFSVLWELGLKTTQDKMAIKIMLTRFISMALKDQGVVGFWGAFVEDGIVILNPQEANFESIFFDVVNRVLIHEAQVQDFREDLSLIKLDRMPNTSARTLKPDDLLSFLLANTTYLGFIHNQSFLSKTVLYLAENYLGKIYPQESFNPGVELKAA